MGTRPFQWVVGEETAAEPGELTHLTEPPTDAAVVNAIARVTGGNFRLVSRLLVEIERVLAVNRLSTVTTEVVAFARESLVIGPT